MVWMKITKSIAESHPRNQDIRMKMRLILIQSMLLIFMPRLAYSVSIFDILKWLLFWMKRIQYLSSNKILKITQHLLIFIRQKK